MIIKRLAVVLGLPETATLAELEAAVTKQRKVSEGVSECGAFVRHDDSGEAVWCDRPIEIGRRKEHQ